jgi:hypothetical protein
MLLAMRRASSNCQYVGRTSISASFAAIDVGKRLAVSVQHFVAAMKRSPGQWLKPGLPFHGDVAPGCTQRRCTITFHAR